MSAIIVADTMGDLSHFFERMPAVATQSARMAINDVAKGKGLAVLRDAMLSDVKFPRDYLKESDKFGVRQSATDLNLVAVISARQRPTSLARFAPGQNPATSRLAGVRVEIKNGKSNLIKDGFLMNLKNGNIGLAIRLKAGERIRNKKNMAYVPMKNGLYLLYGPSVDQVFREVAVDKAPELGKMVADEFFRQFARLSRNA